MTTYQAPKDIWAVNSSLHPNEPLDGDQDPRWVDSYSARGEAALEQIGQLLGVDVGKQRLREPPARGYYLFCGHRRSHPVVRTTDEYKRAAASLGRSKGSS